MGKYFVWDRDERRMVEVYSQPATEVNAPAVHGDEMNKTWHPCDGRYYESKSQFRSVTKAHGCVELGNETIRPKPYKPPVKVADRIREAKEALNMRPDRKRYEEFRRETQRRLEQRDNMRGGK